MMTAFGLEQAIVNLIELGLEAGTVSITSKGAVNFTTSSRYGTFVKLSMALRELDEKKYLELSEMLADLFYGKEITIGQPYITEI